MPFVQLDEGVSRQRSIQRARRQKAKAARGYFVTWDVNSADARQCAKLKRFVYGTTSRWGGRTYRYPGFVEQDGVQYLGQSVLFVTEIRLRTLVEFLRVNGVGHVIRYGSLGTVSSV